MKVDLKLLREAQEIRRKYLMFCDYCGETNPPSGFYPLSMHGPNSVSGVICNKCARKWEENEST